MTLRFSSGSATPASASRNGCSALTTFKFHAGGGHEIALDLLGLAGPQQPVVDEHAGELIADRALHEGGRHRRVDAAGQSQMTRLPPTWDRIEATCSSMMFASVHCGRTAGDVVQEVLQDGLAVLGVQHLGVELDAGQGRAIVLEGRHRGARRRRGHREPVRRAV